jgi:hypothetical protein
MSNTVAENALCWWDGRSSRRARENGLKGFAEEEDSGTISDFTREKRPAWLRWLVQIRNDRTFLPLVNQIVIPSEVEGPCVFHPNWKI